MSVLHDREGLIKEAIKSCNVGTLGFSVAGFDLKNLSCSLFFPSLTNPSFKYKAEKNPTPSIQSYSAKTHECALPDYIDTNCPVALSGQLGDILAASSLHSTCSLWFLD